MIFESLAMVWTEDFHVVIKEQNLQSLLLDGLFIISPPGKVIKPLRCKGLLSKKESIKMLLRREANKKRRIKVSEND